MRGVAKRCVGGGCECVRVLSCVRACVRACMRAFVRLCVHACVRVYGCGCGCVHNSDWGRREV